MSGAFLGGDLNVLLLHQDFSIRSDQQSAKRRISRLHALLETSMQRFKYLM
ncbi:MAG: hypothetical protein ACLUB2_00425 [Butyricicoccus pullicaecorum]